MSAYIAGWSVKSGPDSGASHSPEIVADHRKMKFSVNITLYEENPKGIVVDLVSGCFEVPKGETVDEF